MRKERGEERVEKEIRRRGEGKSGRDLGRKRRKEEEM